MEEPAMVTLIVRFKSGMTYEELMKKSEERAPQYRAQKGLMQKYYLKYSDDGEYGAVYLWDSMESLEAFSKSELRQSIPTAYKVQGTPEMQTAEVVMTLRSEK
jgi:heme-degrading monooxygenase HmoA